MATSGESLKIYMINDEDKRVELKSDLRNVMWYWGMEINLNHYLT